MRHTTVSLSLLSRTGLEFVARLSNFFVHYNGCNEAQPPFSLPRGWFFLCVHEINGTRILLCPGPLLSRERRVFCTHIARRDSTFNWVSPIRTQPKKSGLLMLQQRTEKSPLRGPDLLQPLARAKELNVEICRW